MKFFFPHSTAEEAEINWQGTRTRLKRDCGLDTSERRIYSVTYRDGSEEVTATVEHNDPTDYDDVLAILESDGNILICNIFDGAGIGDPILVRRHQILRIVDFE